MPIKLHIRSIHLSASTIYSEYYVRHQASPLSKFYMILDQIIKIGREASAQPNELYLITCPEGMITSPRVEAPIVSEAEYDYMIEEFKRITLLYPNLLLMPGTLVLSEMNNLYRNELPIFFQGNHQIYLQRITHTSNVAHTEFSGHFRNFNSLQTYNVGRHKSFIKEMNPFSPIKLFFNSELIFLAPQICIEHHFQTLDAVAQTAEWKAHQPHTLQVLLSHSIASYGSYIHADCFIHDDIDLSDCRILMKEGSNFIPVSSKRHCIEYSLTNYLLTGLFFSSTLRSWTSMNIQARDEEIKIEQKPPRLSPP